MGPYGAPGTAGWSRPIESGYSNWATSADCGRQKPRRLLRPEQSLNDRELKLFELPVRGAHERDARPTRARWC